MTSPCPAITDRVWQWLDNELDQPEVNALATHLEGCPTCRTMLEQALRTDRLLHRAATRPIPAGPLPGPRLWRWLGLGGAFLALAGVFAWPRLMTAPAAPHEAEAPAIAPQVAPAFVSPSQAATPAAIAPPAARDANPMNSMGVAFLTSDGLTCDNQRHVVRWSATGAAASIQAVPPTGIVGPRRVEGLLGTGLCFQGATELRAQLPPNTATNGGMLLIAAAGDGPTPGERIATLLTAEGDEALALAWTTRGRRISVLSHGQPVAPDLTLPPDEVVVVCRWWPDGRVVVGTDDKSPVSEGRLSTAPASNVLVIGAGAAGAPRFHGDFMGCVWLPMALDDAGTAQVIRSSGLAPLPTVEPRL